MEEYKQYLLDYINSLESRGYELVYKKEDLDSEYKNGYYQPVIIYRGDANTTIYVWMFDGEIKDCTHPVIVQSTTHGSFITDITYYSSELIENNKPINLYTAAFTALHMRYNNYYEDTPIINGYRKDNIILKRGCIYEQTGIYPTNILLKCEEFTKQFKLKFVD